MCDLDLLGFGFCTGTRYCSRNVYGGYDNVAFVWENGTIVWEIDASLYSREQLLPIYKCSANYINEVNEKKTLLSRLQAEYPTIAEGTVKKLNVRRFILRLKEELSDLEKYKTTAVIHR